MLLRHWHCPNALLPAFVVPRQGWCRVGRQPKVQGPGVAVHGRLGQGEGECRTRLFHGGKRVHIAAAWIPLRSAILQVFAV